MPNFEDSLKFTKRLFILETNNCLPLALDRSVAGSLSGGLWYSDIAEKGSQLPTSALASSLLHTLTQREQDTTARTSPKLLHTLQGGSL